MASPLAKRSFARTMAHHTYGAAISSGAATALVSVLVVPYKQIGTHVCRSSRCPSVPSFYLSSLVYGSPRLRRLHTGASSSPLHFFPSLRVSPLVQGFPSQPHPWTSWRANPYRGRREIRPRPRHDAGIPIEIRFHLGVFHQYPLPNLKVLMLQVATFL